MFKYIFCLIAILMQPIFAFLVFHKQEKQKAALKMPLQTVDKVLGFLPRIFLY